MRNVTPDNAVEELHRLGWLPTGETARIDWLAWGVSNVVLMVRPAVGEAFVVKQSREQLRTKADWFSRLDRIWREVDVMQALHPLLPPGCVPKVLREDRENYLFAMEAVDPAHVVWKGELLEGKADGVVSVLAARMLAAIHRETYGRSDLRASLGDREVFDQLRLDPFYRRVAQAHADLKPMLDALIDETLSRSDCLVQADFSPKNLLIVRASGQPTRLSLVDYETGHYGDPAFDLGFFLSHLLLKTVLHAERLEEYLDLVRNFWAEYRRETATLGSTEAFSPGELDRRAIANLAGCLLARIDGKSTVDYLKEPRQIEFVRQFGRRLLQQPPGRMSDVFDDLED